MRKLWDVCTAFSDTAAQHQKKHMPAILAAADHSETFSVCLVYYKAWQNILPRSLCRVQILITQRSDIRSLLKRTAGDLSVQNIYHILYYIRERLSNKIFRHISSFICVYCLMAHRYLHGCEKCTEMGLVYAVYRLRVVNILKIAKKIAF